MIEVPSVTEILPYIDGLQAIIFDLDDTLYGEKQYVRSGYAAVAKLLPEVENAADKLWQAFLEKKPAIDEVLQREGLATEERKAACMRVYRGHAPVLSLYDGVKEMLLSLREKGYKLGIVTDGRVEGQRAKLQALGLYAFVDEVIVTDSLGGIEYRKPNPTSFIRICERLGVEYERAVYIGDNKAKDFIAPAALGMRTIWVRNTDGLYYEKD